MKLRTKKRLTMNIIKNNKKIFFKQKTLSPHLYSVQYNGNCILIRIIGMQDERICSIAWHFEKINKQSNKNKRKLLKYQN